MPEHSRIPSQEPKRKGGVVALYVLVTALAITGSLALFLNMRSNQGGDSAQQETATTTNDADAKKDTEDSSKDSTEKKDSENKTEDSQKTGNQSSSDKKTDGQTTTDTDTNKTTDKNSATGSSNSTTDSSKDSGNGSASIGNASQSTGNGDGSTGGSSSTTSSENANGNDAASSSNAGSNAGYTGSNTGNGGSTGGSSYTSGQWIDAEACATCVAETGTITASGVSANDGMPQVGLASVSDAYAHFGDYIEIRYGDVTVQAMVVDTGIYNAGAYGLCINPGVFNQFGFSSTYDWGRRMVSYRFI